MSVHRLCHIPGVVTARHLPDARWLLIVRFVNQRALDRPGQVVELHADTAFLGGIQVFDQGAILIDPDGAGAGWAFDFDSVEGFALTTDADDIGHIVAATFLANGLFYTTGEIVEGQAFPFFVVFGAIETAVIVQIVANVAIFVVIPVSLIAIGRPGDSWGQRHGADANYSDRKSVV